MAGTTESTNVEVHAGSSKHAEPVEPDAPENTAPENTAPENTAPENTAPARLEAQRYKVQFTASEEYVQLVEEVQALLSHSAGRAPLDELHLRAMRALAAELKRQKYAVTGKPRRRSGSARPAAPPAHEGCHDANGSSETDEPKPASELASELARPRQRGRYIPAAVRCAVFERDEGRCTYADASGRRCRETHLLELHHLRPFARGGEHTEENLTLRCRAHNALAAEQDFSRDFVALQRGSDEHEPWRSRGAGF